MRFLLSLFLLTYLLLTTPLYAQDFYWIGGSGNWTDTSHWATESGGNVLHGRIPDLNDKVVFDTASFSAGSATVTIDTNLALCDDMDWRLATFTPRLVGGTTDTLRVFGSLQLAPGFTNNFDGIVEFKTAFNDSIDMAGQPFNNEVFFNGAGSWLLKSDLIVGGDFNFLRGDLNCNDFNVEAHRLMAVSHLDRTLDQGSGTFEVTGAGAAWEISGKLTLLGDGGVRLSYPGNDTVFFHSGDTAVHYHNLYIESNLTVFTQAGQMDTLFANPGTELVLPALQDQLLSGLEIDGNCGAPTLLKSNLPGFQANIVKGTGAVVADFLWLSDIQAGGGATFTANNSINQGNVSGWTINENVGGTDFFWIGGGGDWNDATHWSLTSGVANNPSACLPGINDNVFFDAGSGLTNDTVYISKNAYCANMSWAGVLGTPFLDGHAEQITIKGSLTLAPNLNAPFGGDYRFISTAVETIDGQGVLLGGDVYFDSTGQWTCTTDFGSAAAIYHNNGSLLTGNTNFTAAHFFSNSAKPRVLQLNSAQCIITGSGRAWNIDPAGLTFNAGTSVIELNHATLNDVIFEGGNQAYNELVLNTAYTSINGGNTFGLIQTFPKGTVTLQAGQTQQVDSLIADGSCAQPIVIEASSLVGTPAYLEKTGYDTLRLSNVVIKNVNAVVNTTEFYLASNSVLLFDVNGWNEVPYAGGGKFYWIGDAGNWSDTLHWSMSSGGPNASCTPNAGDTVIFDANSFSLMNQRVTVDVDGFCSVMDWTGATEQPELFLIRNLFISGNTTLETGMTVGSRTVSSQIQFIPALNGIAFDTKDVPIDASIVLDALTVLDSLTLLGGLYMTDSTSLVVIEGSLFTNNQYIETGAISFFTQAPKVAALGTSVMDLTFGWQVEDSLLLSSGTSTINILNSSIGGYFHGNDLSYHNLNFYAVPSDSVSLLTGSNTFNDVSLNAGLHLNFEGLSLQNVLGTLSIPGNCFDSIYLNTTDASAATINVVGVSDTAMAVHTSNVHITGLLLPAMFSADGGGNAGWNFINTPATVAGFTTPFHVCLGDTASFTNTSTAISGNVGDLTFEWDFGGGDSAYVANPKHLFISSGLQHITLTSIYSNGCANSYEDSLMVNDPYVFLTAADTNICAGDSVTFTASNTSVDYQFFVNAAPVSGISTNRLYQTDALNDGDVVHVEAIENGCRAASNSFTFKVNPLPVIGLVSSDADDVICDGDTVTFTASGGTHYQFLIDGVSQGFLSTQSTFKSHTLSDGELVTVAVQIDSTGCKDTSAAVHTMTVNPVPVVTVSKVPNTNLICAGDELTFTAGGADNYRLLIDGAERFPFSASNTFSINNLVNGETVSVEGEQNGCVARSGDSTTFIVNPIPVVNLASSDADNTICDGESVTLTASGAAVYEFFLNGVSQGPPSANTTLTTATLINNDAVTVAGSSSGCSDTSVATVFSVLPLPLIGLNNPLPNDTICLGDPVSFSATGGTAYQFFVNNIPATPIQAAANYVTDSLKNNQQVSVVGYQNGCAAQAAVSHTITVNPLPNVNLFSADTAICEGANAQFTGVGANQYEFLIDGVSQGVGAATVFQTTALPAGTPVITLRGYSANGCTKLAPTAISVTVTAQPTIVLSSSDADNVICQGDSVTFTATGADTYQYFVSGVFRAANDTLVATNLTNGQVVSVTGTLNGCAGTGNTTYTMVVNPKPTVGLTSSDANSIICEADTVIFTASGADHYTFLLNNVALGAPSPVHTYLTDTLKQADQLRVMGENTTTGCTAFAAAAYTFQVNPLPIVQLNVSDPDTVICEGEQVTFTASGTNLYEFFLSGVSLGAPSPGNTYVTDSLGNGDLVTVRGRSSLGCENEAPNMYHFLVKTVPTVTLTSSDPDNNICVGDTVQFTAAGANDYTFYVNGIPARMFSTNPVYETDSLVNGDQVSVIGREEGCESVGDTTFTFQVNAYPVVSITSNQPSGELCSGDSIVFLANGASHFEFFVNGLSQGPSSVIDTLTLTNLLNGQRVSVTGTNNGCENSDTTTAFTVYNYPVVNVLSSVLGNTICFGDSLAFTASGAQTYAFYVNGVVQGKADTNRVFFSKEFEDQDVITVLGYNGNCGENALDTHTVNVHKLNLQLTASENSPVCEDELITFIASGADAYTFYINGVQQGATSTNTTFTSALNDGEELTVVGSDFTNNCEQPAERRFLYTVLPNSSIYALSDTVFCEGDSVWLEANTKVTQWYKEGTPIVGEVKRQLLVKSGGNYHATFDQGGNAAAWSVGKNDIGQFGDSSLIDALIPQRAGALDSIVDVQAGNRFNIALRNDGTAYAWGENNFGQLGDGSFTSAIAPVPLTSLTGVELVAAGSAHALALLNNGDLMAWGQNNKGQLGLGTISVTNFPFKVNGIGNVKAVAAGVEHTIVLLNDSTVWAWGGNQFGQLGDSSFTDRLLPVAINKLNKVVAIAAGSYHSLAVTADGRVWSWGNNAEGQLGRAHVNFANAPEHLSHIAHIQFKQVGAGAAHSVALAQNGRLYSWGANSVGQLGNGTTDSAAIPERLDAPRDVQAIAVGPYHAFAKRGDNSFWAWGKNTNGELGDSTKINRLVPEYISAFSGMEMVAAGMDHSTAFAAGNTGCSSNNMFIEVKALPEITIEVVDDTLLVATAGGSVYQWLINGNPIPGANAQTHRPTASGRYSVRVEFANGCVGFSEEYHSTVGWNDLGESGLKLKVYPNPSNGQFAIDLWHVGKVASATLQVHSSVGKLVHNEEVALQTGRNTLPINLRSVSRGFHQLVLILPNGQYYTEGIILK